MRSCRHALRAAVARLGVAPSRIRRRPRRRTALSLGAVAALVFGVVAAVPGTALAAGSQPCDIYAAAGTPCVAAHSTVRALYAAYDGPLYQIRRASDGATTNIGLLSTGGYADSAAQDAFCNDTVCDITEIYDQSQNGNNLTVEGGGGANPDRKSVV